MDAASIRVNASTIKDFAGRVVRVVGRVESFDAVSDSARLDAGGAIDVSIHSNDKLEVGKVYEIIGKVGVSDYKVNVYSVLPLSDGVNVDVANQLAKFVQKVPELFY
ncbi:Replication factor A protein 3 family protein [Clavispora lusitaniae]|uniref:Replication factor A protein 3 family protein n=1 Tax=Clavispora lusitaniae TaxID=36911 RepID=UPI00202BD9A6|nr:Replication factor A protein 3 family protein [Clavispora lusitaniae]